VIALERQFEIVEHGVAVEHGRFLEFAADPRLCDFRLRQRQQRELSQLLIPA